MVSGRQKYIPNNNTGSNISDKKVRNPTHF
jgi:hypothetical protein